MTQNIPITVHRENSLGSTRRRKIILATVLVGLVVLVVLAWSATTGTPLYTNQEVLNTAASPCSNPGDWCRVSMKNSHNAEVAAFNILMPSGVLASAPDRFSIKVEMVHNGTNQLDSFSLILSTVLPNQIQVWLNAPTGGIQMSFNQYGDKAIMSFPNLNFYGAGTVTYDLLLQVFRNSSPFQLNLQSDVTLHDSNYLFTRNGYSGQASLHFLIAENGTITQAY